MVYCQLSKNTQVDWDSDVIKKSKEPFSSAAISVVSGSGAEWSLNVHLWPACFLQVLQLPPPVLLSPCGFRDGL